MDENSAPDELHEATPIFGAYRRGYDPDQVDRYVADQRRRLDEALTRASEAERRLAAAVGQLRELHRRVAVLESEERTQQPQPLDTLGERVQRILQEAWDGAYAIRQTVEQETNELKGRASSEAEEIVAAARRKAEAAEEEIGRRRRAYLERIEQERSRTVSQMTYLQEQRTLAIGELNRIKTLIEATVSEVDAAAAPRRAAPEEGRASAEAVLEALSRDDASEVLAPAPRAPREGTVVSDEPRISPAVRLLGDDLQRTMPVHRLDFAEDQSEERSQLVTSHRTDARERREAPVRELAAAREQRSSIGVFDFDAEDPR
ncbi:MAG TPA: hypothetical protein VNF07_03840 [Acidimicrobiales bacterium]|nr:hypothetical protein [Acidimicrobiales bacterium]